MVLKYLAGGWCGREVIAGQEMGKLLARKVGGMIDRSAVASPIRALAPLSPTFARILRGAAPVLWPLSPLPPRLPAS